MKVAVIGGVASTQVLVEALVRHGFTDLKVWGYEPLDTRYVSGWRNLREFCAKLNLPFGGFRKVTECEEELRDFSPELLFVVGLSQIVPPSIMEIASKANIGFHPTALPRGRGRGALAWLILHGEDGAATFFSLREGVDDGPIFVQEPYSVTDDDGAAEVEVKLLAAEARALDRLLPAIASGELSAKEQVSSEATWLGRRAPEDGWLDWHAQAQFLKRLIQASAPPHPGAYTFCKDYKILILRAALSSRPETGVPGRILKVHEDSSFEVQTGAGLLHVLDWKADTNWVPSVGVLLGYYAEAEIHELRHRVTELRRTVEDLRSKLNENIK